MTYKDAKCMLEFERNLVCTECDPMVGYGCSSSCQFCATRTAYDTAIEALEKQTPKMVKNKGYLGRINAENIYYGECPACGKAVGSASCKKWCDQCGQSLEWSDEE